MRCLTVACLSIGLLLATALCAAPEGDTFILAKPGVKTAIIIGKAQPKYQFPYWGGHGILQRYLMLIASDIHRKKGVNVPIIKDADVEGKDLDALYDYRIWVGDQPKVREAIGADLAKIDDDGFIIRAVGRDLYICGKFKWGTHWAVYDLLEKHAGCRWYMDGGLRWWMPKEDGTIGIGDIIPRAPSVAIPANTNIVEQPAYKMRQFRVTPAHAFRERYRDKFHHALVNIMPPQTVGKDHPEWFPLIKGKRHVPPPNRSHDFQPCTSNPAVISFVANAAIDFFDKNPNEGTFSVGMNDSGNYCECAKCSAIAPARIKEKNARIAYAFFTFYNQVAAAVQKKHPDKRLGCLAYAVLSSLPAGELKLHPMIVPYLTRDSAQLFDPNEQKEFRELVDKWSKLAARMGIYEYIYGHGFLIPRIYNRYLIKNVQERYGVGVDGFYGECGPNWGLDGPKYWLLDKMLWDNTRDPEKLLAEYYTNMFGPAADAMRKYFDFIEETWCTQTLPSSRSNYRWLNDIKQLLIFTPEKCDTAYAMLEETERQVADLLKQEKNIEPRMALQDNLRRVRFFKTSFGFTRMMCTRYAACVELEKLVKKEPVPFGESMRLLELWGKPGPLRPHYEATKKLKVAISTISGHGATLGSFLYHFDRSPGPAKAVRAFSEELVTDAVKRVSSPSKVRIEKTIDALLAKKAAKTPGLEAPGALKLLGDVAKETGLLYVGTARKAPMIDGIINRKDWGRAAYSGRFYTAMSLDDQAPHRTTIYALRDADKLYLAFDCEADPKAMGAAIKGRDTDESSYPKMQKDDAISISIVRKRYPTRRILVNLNGSVQDGKRHDLCEAKVHRTATGWQAEMAIDLKKTALDPTLVAKAPTWLGIARYTRYVKDAKKGTTDTACSTLTPVTHTKGNIGAGNHVACMCFVWGPRVVYAKTTK